MSDDSRELPPAAPRVDLLSAALLAAFGVSVAIASWRMDRLEAQGGSLWTAPGLWPFALGLALVGLAIVLAVRARRRGREVGWNAHERDDTPLVPTLRFAAATALFFVYALALIGRGLPYPVGTAIFVAAYVYAFHDAPGRSTARRASVALAVGIGTALVVTLVFERVFLVRLP
ncbi:MAG: tripartite tricarboxylate transporter TctB family protein [Betaproteobacteria bacterium]